jgi:hypothetical protein
MNYHEKAMEVIETAQFKKMLFTVLMRIARRHPKTVWEIGKALGLVEVKKPVTPPALIKGVDLGPLNTFTTVKPVCKECGKEVKAVGISGRCVACAPESFEIGRRVQEEVVG